METIVIKSLLLSHIFTFLLAHLNQSCLFAFFLNDIEIALYNLVNLEFRFMWVDFEGYHL